MPLEIHSPSDNEINKADITIPDSGELAYDIVKSLQRRNDEDRKICDDNIRERNNIISLLQSNCDHIYVSKVLTETCKKCAHTKGKSWSGEWT
jgi:hypothetical protein